MRTSTMRCLETFAVAAPTRGSAAPSTSPQKWQPGANEPIATHFRSKTARCCCGGLLADCLLDEGRPQSQLQGDDNRPHGMNVKRGTDGRGSPAMRCTNCHQSSNSEFAHAPPGAPN